MMTISKLKNPMFLSTIHLSRIQCLCPQAKVGSENDRFTFSKVGDGTRCFFTDGATASNIRRAILANNSTTFGVCDSSPSIK